MNCIECGYPISKTATPTCTGYLFCENCHEHTTKINTPTVDRLTHLLKRWEEAYSGYAIKAMSMNERLEYQKQPSTENMGSLINDTRKVLNFKH